MEACFESKKNAKSNNRSGFTAQQLAQPARLSQTQPVASIRTVVCDADCLVKFGTKPLLVGRGWATGETLLCVYIDMDIARELLNAAQNGNVVSLDVAGVCLILTVATGGSGDTSGPWRRDRNRRCVRE